MSSFIIYDSFKLTPEPGTVDLGVFDEFHSFLIGALDAIKMLSIRALDAINEIHEPGVNSFDCVQGC